MYTQPPALGKCREVQQIRNIRQERPILIWDLGHFGTRVTVTAVSCTYSKSLNYTVSRNWLVLLCYSQAEQDGTRRDEREQNGKRQNEFMEIKQFLKTALFKSMFAQGVAVCMLLCFYCYQLMLHLIPLFSRILTSSECWPPGTIWLKYACPHSLKFWFSRHHFWNNFGFFLCIKYGKFWSILLGHFIKHKLLISEVCTVNAFSSK